GEEDLSHPAAAELLEDAVVGRRLSDDGAAPAFGHGPLWAGAARPSDRLEVLDEIALLLGGEAQLEGARVVIHHRRQVGGAPVVEVRRVLPEGAERRRAVLLRGT